MLLYLLQSTREQEMNPHRSETITRPDNVTGKGKNLCFRLLSEYGGITGDVLIRKSQIATDCDFLR